MKALIDPISVTLGVVMGNMLTLAVLFLLRRQLAALAMDLIGQGY